MILSYIDELASTVCGSVYNIEQHREFLIRRFQGRKIQYLFDYLEEELVISELTIDLAAEGGVTVRHLDSQTTYDRNAYYDKWTKSDNIEDVLNQLIVDLTLSE